jgi:hypothetical protein
MTKSDQGQNCVECFVKVFSVPEEMSALYECDCDGNVLGSREDPSFCVTRRADERLQFK